MTRKELAERARVCIKTVRKLENCPHAGASWTTMRALAVALGLPVSSVFPMEDIQHREDQHGQDHTS